MAKTNTRPLALDSLEQTVGPPLTTSEMARMLGVAHAIKGGHLRAVRIGRGRKRVFRILTRDAIRYARSLGLLTDA